MHTVDTSLRAFGRATPKNGASRPYSILTNILTKWIVKARANGHTVLVGGDFNASLEGHAGKRDLRGIATSLQLTAPLIQTLNTEDPYFTFFRKDRGISRIDHILHTPLPTYIQISGNGCYTSDALTAATFDHRPVWTDLCISGTGPPLPKEQHLQIPPRLNINPADQEMVEEYQQHLSTHHQSLPEPSEHPHPADRAATKLALIHRITIDAAHDTRSADRTKKTRIHHLCQRKRSRFKDGFSAEMRVIQTALHLVIYLKRKFFNRAGYLHPHVDDTRLYSLTRRGLQRWEVTIAALDHASEDPSHPPTTIIKPAVDPRQMLTWTVATINSTHFDTLRDNLTRMLQGRARTEMRKRMTHRTHTIQAHLELQHIGKVLQTIGLKRKQTPPLTRLTLEDGATLTLPIDIQDELNKHFTAHHSIPSGLDPVAHKLHHDDTWWHELAAGADMNTPLHPHSAIPDHHQLGLRNLCKTKVTSATAKKIQDALRQQITISEFHSTLDGMAKDKAPGPSMVTTNMIKKWTPEIKIEVLGLLQTLWTHRHVPRWWRDRVMTPLLKKPGHTSLKNLRPIGLLEVLRKLMTRIITHRLLHIWEEDEVLHPAQHGYRWRHGTDTAILRVLAATELAKLTGHVKLCTFWDFQKAFDSIAPNLLKLAWARLGVPDDTIKWLSDLDDGGRTFIWTPHMADNIDPRSLEELLGSDGSFIQHPDMGFSAERGVTQGGTESTVAWIVIFDMILCWSDLHDDIAKMRRTQMTSPKSQLPLRPLSSRPTNSHPSAPSPECN
ncbi:MAG: hypothetical protein CMH81_06050 [Nitrospiraceae bacterium]|nr:hypothetical protein [Nitrospiraceae bacterium]